jgi:3',5'-cyclic AMP phosphodiesterase CpdA
MPIHVSPQCLSRRNFLVASTATTASLALSYRSLANENSHPNRFALLSDTHIPSSPDVIARGVNMTENLRAVVAELCKLSPQPAAVILNGDCAYLKGLPGDYANLAECVAPLGQAGLDLHLTMGNHDDRGPLYDALADQRPDSPPIESKHVTVIQSPHANLFLLDSLRQVDVVTGELGEEQLAWLASELDARADKPAVIIAHHNPQFQAPPEGQPWGGLRDTDSFFDLITRRKQVKAFVFGHTHDWSTTRKADLHLINLPPVAYVFADDKPSGWVLATLAADGIELELRTHDTTDRRHGQKWSLDW